MSVRRLALLFGLAFAVLLPALLPLRLGLRLVDLGGLGLHASAASGSVWAGRLHNVRLHGRALGDIDVRLAPLPLLAGTRRLTLAGDGARLAIQQGRRHGIVDARGGFALDDLAAAPGLAVTLRSDGATVLFGDGRCHVADGRLDLALRRAGSETVLAALAGNLACDADAATVTLAPVAAAAPPFDGLRVELHVESDGGYRLQSLLPAPSDDAARLVLEAAGFQLGPAGWSRVDAGRLVPD